MKLAGRLPESGMELLSERVNSPRSLAQAATTTLYRLYDKQGDLLYVGISVGGLQRLKQHRDSKDWFLEVASATFTHYPSRAEALKAEAQAIHSEHPRYNVALPHPNPKGYRPRKSKIEGLSDEQVASLDKLTRQHFGMEVDAFLVACRTGGIDVKDDRLRYVTNFLKLMPPE
jgi:predicted GIY-YIG superfamily endonuclease